MGGVRKTSEKAPIISNIVVPYSHSGYIVSYTSDIRQHGIGSYLGLHIT